MVAELARISASPYRLLDSLKRVCGGRGRAQNPSAFNDITTGSGGGCSAGLKRVDGFPAKKGWDPVTGLGTPNLPAMIKLLG